MKTSKLTGVALDWAVAKCEGRDATNIYGTIIQAFIPRYSIDWAEGGPIIEREVISLIKTSKSGFWSAYFVRNTTVDYERRQADADTPLVAAMRCYVASKLGDEVEIPAELQETT